MRLAGPLGMSVDGRVADTARLSRHDTLALAYLIVERSRRVSRSELSDVIWDERIPASWQTLLRGSMSRLRAALGDVDMVGALVTGAGWYQLTLPAQTVVDIEDASRAAREAEGLLGDASPDAPTRAAKVAQARLLAEAAHDLARQSFLAGVNAAWVGLRQQLLDDLRLHCIELIARAALHNGDWNDARHWARLALGRAPLRESVYRLLALAHCGAGDRGEALSLLATCRRVLAEELGAGLSPETDALNTGLLRGVPATDLFLDMSSPPAVAVPHAGARPAALRRLTEESTPFVGRAVESDQLRHAWKRAMDGMPQVALVAGEAGAGKSRLIAEFAATVAVESPTILYGQCDVAGSVLVEALGAHLTDHARAAPHAAGLAEAVRSTLCRLGRAGPVLLVIEDLHELNRDSLAMLRYVLRCPDPLPLLVAGTFRTGDDPVASTRVDALLAAWRSAAPVVRIELAGLSQGELTSLVRLLAGRPPAAQLVSTIGDATGGNPFFVRELMQLWDDQGRTAHAGAELALVDSAAEGVPLGVRETILARCARLGDSTRRVLGVAAVAGREVDLRILEVVPELSTVDVLEALEEAVASHLMTEPPGVNGRFAFVHGLVPETLYGELTTARRRRLHADLATAIENRPGGAPYSVASVAQHLLRGGTGVSARATMAAARAGADATSRHAYDEAVHFFTAAVDSAGSDPVARCRLRLQLAEARWRSGDTAGAGVEFRATALLAQQVGRPDLASRAIFGATGHGPNLLGCDRAAAAEIEAVLRDMDAGDPYRPRLLSRLGAELAGAPDPRSRDHCVEALALADGASDESTIAYALNGGNWASLGDSADQNGLARADRMLALADAVNDRHMMLEARLWRATFLLRAGQTAEVGPEVAALEELAVALRQPFYLRLPLRLRATLAALDGRAEEAAKLAAEVYPMERRAHAREAEAHSLLRAVTLAPSLQSWPEPNGVLSTLDGHPWAVVRAVCLAAIGRVDDAEKALAPVLADSGVALRHHILTPFVAVLLARSCAADEQWSARVDQATVRSVLLPWAGTHAVAGCGVASLGPVDAWLAAP